jgi:hypothetical protein
MKRHSGRLLLSFVAVVATVVPYVADWNETHLYHAGWSPHAKFHVAHTMLLGSILGLLSLRYLWRRAGDPLDNLRVGALFVAAYWLGQAGSILVPGTAVVDPEFADRIPTVAGARPNQVYIDAVLLILVIVGYRWQRTRLPGRTGTDVTRTPRGGPAIGSRGRAAR